MRASSALWSAAPLPGADAAAPGRGAALSGTARVSAGGCWVAAVRPPVAYGRSWGSVTGELRVDDRLVLLGPGTGTGAVARAVAGGGCAGRRSCRREAAGELLQIGDQRAHAIQPGLLGDRRARIGDRLLGARLVVH